MTATAKQELRTLAETFGQIDEIAIDYLVAIIGKINDKLAGTDNVSDAFNILPPAGRQTLIGGLTGVRP